VRTTTWVPNVVSVASQDGATLSHSLILEDEHEVLVVPMTRGDARRIGGALLGYETCTACGCVVELDGHAAGCPLIGVDETIAHG
jgi:hypothetical protein